MIEFERHAIRIAHLNVRTEAHGEEDVIAVDLKLTFELPGSVLEFLSPGLRDSLFAAANDADMFTGEHAPPPMRVRHPHFGALKWSETWHGMRLTLHAGAKPKDDFAFEAVTIGRLSLRPRDGGAVAFEARAQVHPTEAQTAKLVELLTLKCDVPATLDGSAANEEGDDAA